MKIGVNEYGLRVGQDHQNAKLSDREVDLIRRLHHDGMSYRQLAHKFDVSKSTVASIVKYQRRGQIPVYWKEVKA